MKFAFRQLLKNPGYTVVVVLTLALGIGANTAIFSVLNTLMLRPLPYPEQERLVRIFRTSPQSQSWPHSVANFIDQRDQNTVFENLAAIVRTRFGLAEPGDPAESLQGLAATFDLFSALRAQAALGRIFTSDDDQPGRNQVVVLSHSFWMRRFAGDTNIIGRILRIDGERVAVIGILSPSFEYPQLWGVIDACRPLAFTAEQRGDRRNSRLDVVARLKPEVSMRQAEAAVKSLASRLAASYPEANAESSMRLAPLHESIGDESSRRFAWLLFVLTGFVLLIACVNLANLELSRAATRSRELAVRLALGAGRGRLMAQLLFESLILALLGAGAGLVLAARLSEFIGSHLTRWSPSGVPIILDSRVLLFATLCGAFTAALFGLVPAWLASGTDMNDVLKASTQNSTTSHSHHQLRHALIVGEVALALTLLTAASLFLDGMKRFIHQDPGWRVDGLLSGWLPQTGSRYSTLEQRRTFVEKLEQRLSAIPGVERAAISASVPIWAFGSTRGFIIEGQAPPPLGQEPVTQAEAVTPSYFDTLGIRPREGRLFTAGDRATQPDVVIINESMARHFWPGQSPIGKRIGGPDRDNPGWQKIVGIVNDIRFPANLNRPETAWQIYRPLDQEPRPFLCMELRTVGPPESLAPALRRAVAELDPDLPVNELSSTRHHVDRILGHFTLAGLFLACFSGIGLALAALGIYGVISYLVLQRTNEIGIRIALGAKSPDVLWLILSKGLRLSLLGAAIGMAGALGVARLLTAAVPELPAFQLAPFLGVIGLLIAAAMLACFVPARRATKIDPIEALRYE